MGCCPFGCLLIDKKEKRETTSRKGVKIELCPCLNERHGGLLKLDEYLRVVGESGQLEVIRERDIVNRKCVQSPRRLRDVDQQLSAQRDLCVLVL